MFDVGHIAPALLSVLCQIKNRPIAIYFTYVLRLAWNPKLYFSPDKRTHYMMPTLVRLQIPRGWTISDNKFYDVDPVFDSDGMITNWHEGFTEDVLWIQQNVFSNGRFETPTSHCIDIIMSFLQKEYVLKLMYTSADAQYEVEKLHSKDRMLVRDTLEDWLLDITEEPLGYISRMKEVYPDS